MKLRRVAGAVLVLAVGTGCDLQPNSYTFPGQEAVGDDGYTLTVGFDKVENLVPNSNVQLDNVTVGTVTKIKVDENWQAQVTLRISDEQELPVGSTFAIGQKTLLGAQYVEVARPADVETTRAMLSDGDVVPADVTGTYPSTEQVLGAASLLLNNGGLSQISTITGELSTALHGRVPNTRDLVTRLDRLLTVLDANKSDIVQALEALSSLSSDLDKNKAVLSKALERIAPGLRSLNQERGRLVRAVKHTGLVSVDAARLIAVNERALLANLRALNPILTRLGTVAGALPDALKIGLTIPFPVMTTDQAIRGDYANLFATLDLRGSSLAALFLGGNPTAALAGLTTTTAQEPVAPSKPTQGSAKSTPSSIPLVPSPSPSAGPSTQAPSCDLLSSLLGGCP